MSYKDKYYYFDKDGNKKKYVGNVTVNENGEILGTLTKTEQVESWKELIYHPEVEEVKGYFSYYSYINADGEEIMQFDGIKRDEEGNPYFTYSERNVFNLDYNEPVKGNLEYYTYIDPATKEEHVYEGKRIRQGSKTIGMIQK